MQKGWKNYLFFLHPAELIRGAKPKQSTTMKIIIAMFATVGLLILGIAYAQKVSPGSPEWQAKQKAIEEGRTLIKMIDKIFAGGAPTVEECRNGFETIPNLRKALNNQVTTTTEILADIEGMREWIRVSTTIGMAGESGSNKMGWLTSAQSILKIGMARARWSSFIALLDESVSLTKMTTPSLCEAEVALISVKQFLEEIEREESPLTLKQIKGACLILTGKDEMLDWDIPRKSSVKPSLARIREILEERSRQTQIANGN